MVLKNLDLPLLKKGYPLEMKFITFVYKYFRYGLMFELPCPQYILEIKKIYIIKT